MVDTRFKDSSFDLGNTKGQCADWQRAQIAALYDIRDELKSLNSLLHCSNFIDIPHILRGIRKNTTKPKRKKKTVANRGTVI